VVRNLFGLPEFLRGLVRRMIWPIGCWSRVNSVEVRGKRKNCGLNGGQSERESRGKGALVKELGSEHPVEEDLLGS